MPLPYNAPSMAIFDPAIHIFNPILAQITRGGNTAAQGGPMLSYRSCTLCPRRCGVDREAGELGFCRMPGQLRAARAMLHYGEEPPICANYGTGAVFFSGCTLRCRYCQNGVISTGGAGETLTPEALRSAVEQTPAIQALKKQQEQQAAER